MTQERGEVIFKNKRIGVIRIEDAGSSRVARTQIASRVVRWRWCGFVPLDLPAPGSLRAMRRNQNPFPCQDIEPAMRVIMQVNCVHKHLFLIFPDRTDERIF